jgi:hypothetical protein
MRWLPFGVLSNKVVVDLPNGVVLNVPTGEVVVPLQPTRQVVQERDSF